MDKFNEYNGNRITVEEARLKSGGKKATVPTQVDVGGATAKLTYSLFKGKRGWLVYDVEIEGVRLTSTYRGQFSEVFRKEKFDGLMAALDGLIEKARKEG